MKVLHVSGYYHPATEWGGPVRSVHLLCTSLVKAGVACEVVTTNQRGRADLPRCAPGTQPVDGVTVHYHEALPPRRYFMSLGMVADLARRVRQVDVVHIHGIWIFPTLAAARLCRLAGTPYVLSPRGSLDPWALNFRSWKKQPYLQLIEKETIDRAARIHFTTRLEMEVSPEWVPRSRSAVIPNPVEWVQADPATLSSLDVVYSGRLHPMKGIDVLLRAFAVYLVRFPSARLHIAGPDEDGYGAELRRLARELGIEASVAFHGLLARPQLNRLLAEGRMLVLPSHRENFGNVVAEAMAVGIPVVVSREVNMQDAIAAEEAGIVTDRNPQEVAAAMIRLGEDPGLARRMGESGRALVERFRPEVVARETLEMYQQIAR